MPLQVRHLPFALPRPAASIQTDRLRLGSRGRLWKATGSRPCFPADLNTPEEILPLRYAALQVSASAAMRAQDGKPAHANRLSGASRSLSHGVGPSAFRGVVILFGRKTPSRHAQSACGSSVVPVAFPARLWRSTALTCSDPQRWSNMIYPIERTWNRGWPASMSPPSVRRQGIAAALVSAVEVERGVPARPKCGSPVGYDDPNPDL